MNIQIKWKPEYSVGIESIDQQHQELFNTFNKLAKAISGQYTPSAAANAMHEMSQYLSKHFNFEEPLLEKHPDFDAHQLEHLNFIEKTLDFQISFANRDKKMHNDILYYLAKWLKNHILKMDREFFEYLNQNKHLNK